MASLIPSTTRSPRPAYRRLVPPSTRMTSARRAPELSAMRRMLSCWPMAHPLRAIGLFRPLHDLDYPPPNRLRERPGLHDAHRVADLGVVLVSRLHGLGPRHLLAI